MRSPVRMLLAIRSFHVGVLLFCPAINLFGQETTHSILTIEDSPSKAGIDSKTAIQPSSAQLPGQVPASIKTWSGKAPAKLTSASKGTKTLLPNDRDTKTLESIDRETELVRDRFPSGKPRVERRVTLDAEGNYVNHGEYREFSDKGDLLVSGSYQQGQRTGVWAKFLVGNESQLSKTYPFAKLRPPFTSSVEFEMDHMQGVWVISDRDKRVACQIELQHGQRHGTMTFYHPNGQVYLQSTYVNGVLDGPSLEKNQEGKVVRDELYTTGRKQVVETEHFNNKSVKSIMRFLTAAQQVAQPDNWVTTTLASYSSAGEKTLQGEFITYHENGQIASKGNYENGQLHGSFESWYRNGELSASGGYDHGQQHGPWTWRHANGMKRAVASYDKGEPQGEIRAWDDKGKALVK